MRTTKPFYICAALSLALASCTTTSKLPTTYVDKYDKVPLKNAPLAENDLKRWSHLDLVKDTVPGMSVDRAYAELLVNKKPTEVIVAIVDSGIDINHEDLKPAIWVNPNETANGNDDDNNGYIDDINGWNFLGDSDAENMEYVRIIKKGNTADPEYQRAVIELEADVAEAKGSLERINVFQSFIDVVEKATGKTEDITLEDIQKIEVTDELSTQAKNTFTRILAEVPYNEFKGQITGAKNHYETQLNSHLNVAFDGRTPVGDNPDDITDTNYGNNNVIGPVIASAKHGTHVAGIVAQTRGNELGGDGVANGNVKIMALRAVPDGDEYDKDIALAIRYAADNGAKVLNGSFGKYYSPNKEWVQDALKYAEEKDVLVLFAAGNDSKDLDVVNKYPSDSYDGAAETLSNVMIIGALNPSYGENMVAGFSNYGANNVDIFAPGAKIYATTPENNYEYLQGTSMASPNAAGVAAVIRSYYPNLTAAEVKQILMDSGITLTQDVRYGENKDKKPFNELSKSGKIINLYNAVILAEKVSNAKK
ncbi:S8 family peptidase [Flavobacterium agricola]|uniref:S8 family peptidase n=1 Tax=Flavobacterium agricola TaxID=2870839 RepID=A0ABY6LXR8_9FLAO|nr:S8 family peptidase [Flavobacterium agricola]UYW01034.1 S8 family peptidase [Flavobacterium agricola]